MHAAKTKREFGRSQESYYAHICNTHGRKIQRDEAPKVLAPPTTANLAEKNFLLKVVLSH